MPKPSYRPESPPPAGSKRPSGGCASDPTQVRSRDDFVSALRQRRKALGLTCLELDHRAGFHQGYTSHLEHPERRTGRGSLSLNAMAQIWLEALGLDLVLVEKIEPDRGRGGQGAGRE